DGGIGIELAAPPCVAEKDDGGGSVAAVLGRECAAHGGLHAKHLKEVRNYVDAGGRNGRAATAAQLEVIGAGESEVSGHVLKGARIHAKLVEGIGRIGCTGQTALGRRRSNPKQLLRIG